MVDDLEAWMRRQEALEFLATTRLLWVRPHACAELSPAGQYERLCKHIAAHRWYLGIEQDRAVPYEEALASWYDHVYLPIVEIIRAANTLREFPNRTEADLYLWIIERHWYLRQAGLLLAEGQTLAEIVCDYAEEFGERPLAGSRG